MGLISRHWNRSSNNRLKDAVADRALGIIRAQYADFGPTLAAEKPRERHGVNLAVETARSLMDGRGWAVAAAQVTLAEDPAAEDPTRVYGYGASAASAAGVPFIVTRSAYFADTHIDAALAVGPGLHERQGWQPMLGVRNDSPARVGLEDLEAWRQRTQRAVQFEP